MARTIIGLFEDAPSTRTALQDLVSEYRLRGSIGILADRRRMSFEDLTPVINAVMHSEAGMVQVIFLAQDDLIDALDEIDVPEADVQTYAEGLQQGEVLVSVEVDYSDFDRLWEAIGRRAKKRYRLRGRPFLTLMGTHGHVRGPR
jgi:hypothetical protein